MSAPTHPTCCHAGADLTAREIAMVKAWRCLSLGMREFYEQDIRKEARAVNERVSLLRDRMGEPEPESAPATHLRLVWSA